MGQMQYSSCDAERTVAGLWSVVMVVGSGTTGSVWGCQSNKDSKWRRKTRTTCALHVQVSHLYIIPLFVVQVGCCWFFFFFFGGGVGGQAILESSCPSVMCKLCPETAKLLACFLPTTLTLKHFLHASLQVPLSLFPTSPSSSLPFCLFSHPSLSPHPFPPLAVNMSLQFYVCLCCAFFFFKFFFFFLFFSTLSLPSNPSVFFPSSLYSVLSVFPPLSFSPSLSHSYSFSPLSLFHILCLLSSHSPYFSPLYAPSSSHPPFCLPLYFLLLSCLCLSFSFQCYFYTLPHINGEVGGLYWNHFIRLSICPFFWACLDISWTAQPFLTKLGLLVRYHDVVWHAEKLVQCLCHNGGLYNQNMTVFYSVF